MCLCTYIYIVMLILSVIFGIIVLHVICYISCFSNILHVMGMGVGIVRACVCVRAGMRVFLIYFFIIIMIIFFSLFDCMYSVVLLFGHDPEDPHENEMLHLMGLIL